MFYCCHISSLQNNFRVIFDKVNDNIVDLETFRSISKLQHTG